MARVHVQAWRESYRDILPKEEIDERSVEHRTAQWRGTLAEGDAQTFVHVAELEGAICGFASGGRIRWTGLSTDSEISSLYLLDSAKRRGVGRALFGHLLGELADAGFKSTGLWVLTANGPAKRFYEAMGGRAGETRIERRDAYVLDEVAYVWDDVAAVVSR
jgi:ribosomal protein S18 acetylase RimI-like enzyme